jgi:hypothetical protein
MTIGRRHPLARSAPDDGALAVSQTARALHGFDARPFIILQLERRQSCFSIADQLAKDAFYLRTHREPKSGSHAHDAVTEPDDLVLRCHRSLPPQGILRHHDEMRTIR